MKRSVKLRHVLKRRPYLGEHSTRVASSAPLIVDRNSEPLIVMDETACLKKPLITRRVARLEGNRIYPKKKRRAVSKGYSMLLLRVICISQR